MQMTKNGIPCNVPMDYSKRVRLNVVKKKHFIGDNPHKNYSELTRNVDGMEQTIIVPVKTKEYRKAIDNGFIPIDYWTVGG